MITDRDRVVISQQIRIAQKRLKSGNNREQVERDLFLFLYQHGFKQGVFHDAFIRAFGITASAARALYVKFRRELDQQGET